MEEIWKPIQGFGNAYEVSSFGRVRSLPRKYRSDAGVLVNKPGKELRGGHDRLGYVLVRLNYNGLGKTEKVHRLVAEAFIPNPQNKKTVNHIDGNRANNHVDNLEWATQGENMMHSYRELGRPRNGGRHKVMVVCVETGEIFNSITEAAEAKGVKKANLHAVISPNSYKKTCGGFRWKKYSANERHIQ